MKTNMFWQGLSCVALIAALAVVVMHVTSERPAKAGGAAIGGIIAVTEVDGSDARLYIIDPGRKVLLVYGSYRQKDKFRLLAGRYFEYDIAATVGMDRPFKAQGYSARDMKNYADKKKNTR
jgi:hypothetical protein